MLNMALHITWFTPINGFTPIMILHTVRDGKAADDPILRIENISKNYGPVQALCGVTTAIRRGAIHGLLGENGAGKSTLVGIISGQVTPTSGRIFMDGRLLEHVDVKAMEEAGVFLVTQEPMIIDKMTTAENLMLGIWPTKNGVIDWKTLRSDAARILDGSGINASTLAGHLDAVARRKLNILRAMFSGGKVIILDEPTAALPLLIGVNSLTLCVGYKRRVSPLSSFHTTTTKFWRSVMRSRYCVMGAWRAAPMISGR